MELYPLQFNSIFSYRIWGGDKLKTKLNKNIDQESIGESWELSDVKGNETTVKEGPLQGKTLKELIGLYKSDLVGKSVYKKFGNNFPLLLKFIDAKTPLSIQVHPSNELAKERHNSIGKNEMWYIIETEEDAELLVGFNQILNKKTYTAHIENDTLLEVLNKEKVKPGDVFYIPTGRVHAIGGGVLLAEIQQTSDITYRLYDYNRIDKKTGELRDLHNELAIDALDFEVYNNYKTDYNKKINQANSLVNCPYFKTNFLYLNNNFKRELTKIDSFLIYMCVEGHLALEHQKSIYNLNKGETLLIPANSKEITLNTNHAKLIEVYL